MTNILIAKATAALQESVASIIGCDESDATKRFALAESFTQFQDYMERSGVSDIAKAHRDRGAGGHRSLTGALLEHLHDRLERRREQHGYTKSAKESNMRSETLESILKDGGPVSVCKAIVDRGRSPCGEHELVAALTKAASEQQPQLSPAQAFAELYKTEAVWRAIGIAKSMPFRVSLEPLQVGGVDAMHEANDDTERSEAYRQLLRIGRDRWPSESEARQFSNSISDPANAALAAKALRRPSANSVYEFPRR
jgi:hypothetical protein